MPNLVNHLNFKLYKNNNNKKIFFFLLQMSISKNQSGTGSRLVSPRKIEETLIFPERLMNWPWSTFFVAQEKKKQDSSFMLSFLFSLSGARTRRTQKNLADNKCFTQNHWLKNIFQLGTNPLIQSTLKASSFKTQVIKLPDEVGIGGAFDWEVGNASDDVLQEAAVPDSVASSEAVELDSVGRREGSV